MPCLSEEKICSDRSADGNNCSNKTNLGIGPKLGFNSDWVITGISGRFPEADNVNELYDVLYNGINAQTIDDRLWPAGLWNLPKRCGKLKDITKFDAKFFGYTDEQAAFVDPQVRIAYEVVYEAILDAGIDPDSLRGTNTGVFLGTGFNMIETYLTEGATSGQLTEKVANFSNRMSTKFNFMGPSMDVDTACSSSLQAMMSAMLALECGHCDAAIVAGVQININPKIWLMYDGLGMISPDGQSKVWDQSANGFGKADAVVAILIQRASVAKRVYARILHTVSNCDGYKEQGITFPSTHSQRELMSRAYKESGVNPLHVQYMEAHGTGTPVGDPQEIKAIADVFCPGRDQPLLIGAVKTNIGHAEMASGLCSLVKVLLTFEHRLIPANLHYHQVNPNIEPIIDGRLKPVAKNTPFVGRIAALNGFGFGGSNIHVILESNGKEPLRDKGPIHDRLPTLLLYCGRTEESVKLMLNHVWERYKASSRLIPDGQLSREYFAMINDLSKISMDKMQFRGFLLLDHSSKMSTIAPAQKIAKTENAGPLVILFSGGNQPSDSSFIEQMAAIHQFAASIQTSKELVGDKDINSFPTLITITTQIAIIDVLRHLNVHPQKAIGLTQIDNFACQYAEGGLTAAEAVANSQSASFTAHSQTREWHLHHLSEDAVIIDASFGNGDKNVEKHSQADGKVIKLFDKETGGDHLKMFFNAIGQLYLLGYQPKIENIYPPVEYPCPRMTPSISSLIRWDHSKTQFLSTYPVYFNDTKGFFHIDVDLENPDDDYLSGHCIDGRVLFPATGYLHLAWTTMCRFSGTKWEEIPVAFENVNLHRATVLPKAGNTRLTCRRNESTGYFTIYEGGQLIVDGRIFVPDDNETVQNMSYLLKEKFATKSKHVDNKEIILNSKEIYKELRLRGYDYGKTFQGIQEASINGLQGKIKWTGNWITFVDAMLQMSILNKSTRGLRLPVRFESLRCDPRILLATPNDTNLEVIFDHYTNICVSDGIQIKGLKANIAPRKLHVPSLMLEEYKFVAHDEQWEQLAQDINIDHLQEKSVFTNERLIRSQMDIVVENNTTKQLSVLEITSSNSILRTTMTDYLHSFGHNLAIDYTVGHPSPANLPSDVSSTTNVITWNENPLIKTQYDLIVFQMSKYFDSCGINQQLEFMSSVCRENGFLLALLSDNSCAENVYKAIESNKFKVIGQKLLHNPNGSDFASAIFARKIGQNEAKKENQVFVHIKQDSYYWVEELKSKLADAQSKPNGHNVWLLANDSPTNGIIGLVNCLRQEPGGDRIRCIFNCSNSTIHNELMANIICTDLVVNVFKYYGWGSYRHFNLSIEPHPKDDKNLVETEHAFLNVATRGDLSSFRWYVNDHHGKYSSLKSSMENSLSANKTFINIYYSSINFKDVMLASGKLPPDALPDGAQLRECLLGFEFSGRDQNGNRLCGMVGERAMATNLLVDEEAMHLCWPFPSEWSMEEAATVPCVYATCYYALLMRAKLEPGQSVLIHSGSGGVGQAAISICLSMACQIFTTVGSSAKREFLKKLFPELKDRNFSNSRDLSFEDHIKKETNGRGVDIILNSLSEEKLQASLRCLADGGTFLEIGKYDLSQNNRLELSQLFNQNKTFHGIHLDYLINDPSGNDRPLTVAIINRQRQELRRLMTSGMASGVVRPLQRNVFGLDQVEDAFRFMASGKHMGKVLIKIRDEQSSIAAATTVPLVKVLAIPRTRLDPEKCYIITGGLGGFGLELAQWLADHGAKKLILTSRSGAQTAYQLFRIQRLHESGVNVKICKHNASTLDGAKLLITVAQTLGPVGGIFNLAMVLRDAIIENQTVETFAEVCAPKVNGIIFLDKISRDLCTSLDYFVAFSSVSCGRGNAGQTNYGYANSVQERVCEQRRADGLHGLAIQWGAIGDVGIVAESMGGNDIVIGGSLPQRIPSCLAILDRFLQSPSMAVCSSIVKADKRADDIGKKDLMKKLSRILGVKDLASLEPNVTLVELGMDSLMGVEIKQTLESDFGTTMSIQEIRNLKISSIQEINQKAGTDDGTDSGLQVVSSISGVQPSPEAQQTKMPIFEFLEEEFIRLNHVQQGKPIFFLPPIEGHFNLLTPLANQLSRPAIGLTYRKEFIKLSTIEELASIYVQIIQKLDPEGDNFHLIGYSFGGLAAYEMSLQMQKNKQCPRKIKNLILLDSSPNFIAVVAKKLKSIFALTDDKTIHVEALTTFMSEFAPIQYHQVRDQLLATDTREERMQKFEQIFTSVTNSKNLIDLGPSVAHNVAIAAEAYATKHRMLQQYKRSAKFEGDALLIRADDIIFKGEEDVKEELVANDYQLSEAITGRCAVVKFPGDHKSFITNNVVKIASVIMKRLEGFI